MPDLPTFSAVIAETQSNGRGRSVSKWHDSPGQSALMSVFVRWSDPVKHSFDVNAWVCTRLSEFFPSSVEFKWPNDLMVANKKLGGMLIENHWGSSGIRSSIIGLGINVHQAPGYLRRSAFLDQLVDDRFIEVQLEGIFTPLNVCVGILNQFQKHNPKISAPVALRSRYEGLLWGKDDWRVYESNTDRFEAKVKGVDGEGRLILLTRDFAEHTYGMDEVRWVNPYKD
ncbi:MAG: hypothetical protein RL754_94 [Bacteroidota bacterium]